MLRMYSPNAPYRTFWEQTHIAPSEEFSAGWREAARAVRTREDLERRLSRSAGLYTALLERLYAEHDSILALGAGDGLHEFPLLKRFPGKKIVLTDIAPDFLLKIQEFYGVEAARMDARAIAFPDETFDLVYGLSAEYFFDDDDLAKMLAEMARVARPGKPVLISSNAVDLGEKDPARALYRLGQRLLPPAAWVLLNGLLGRRLKWVGYSRTIEDFIRVAKRVPSLRLEEIHFDSAEQGRPALAFLLRKHS